MLITCPECQLQVSDKATACPHCGYPMKSSAPQPTPQPKYQSKKHPRLPNGFGQITELKGRNLRNRFRVMVSDGKTEYGKPIQKLLQPQAYFSSYKDAYEALLEYHKNPLELDKSMTISELHDLWKKEGKSNPKTYAAAWTYCGAICALPVKDLRPRHIKLCITPDVPPTIKPLIKIMFNLMLDYAVEYEIVEKNYARSFEISSDINEEIKENQKQHIPFTDSEIQTLWENISTVPDVDLILIQCYMGWRPQELCLLRLEDVNLDKNYIVGGLKTEAGKGRIVPIHPRIRPLIERRMKQSTEAKSEFLFLMDSVTKKHKTEPKPIKYHRYRERMERIMAELGLNPDHKPHDPRKHFVTMAKKHDLDEYAIKRIVGHRIVDITEAIYTDRDPAWLYEEICKIP